MKIYGFVLDVGTKPKDEHKIKEEDDRYEQMDMVYIKDEKYD